MAQILVLRRAKQRAIGEADPHRNTAPARTSSTGISLLISSEREEFFPHSVAADFDPFVGYKAR